MKYILILTLFVLVRSVQAQSPALPYLKKHGEATQLIVDGKPYLVLGGELRNSSNSNLTNLRPIWPRLVKANINTVLATVSWEQMEPQEGVFDFTLIDGLIDQARENKMKVILLWFGSWKNTVSTYVPGWVKEDFNRFPRIKNADGSGQERLSTISEANKNADKLAFKALMRHLREKDGAARTVIMVQVENEVGMYPNRRDLSDEATSLFGKPVPGDLMNYLVKNMAALSPILKRAWTEAGLKKSGNWEEVFGKGRLTDDFFQSWTFATYINSVAEAGKKEYPLPLFVNTALNEVSGGPQDKVMDIWKAVAPAIDLLTPDVYYPQFAEYSARYHRSDNALFVPEARFDSSVGGKAMYAIGQHDAIGFSPFAIDGNDSVHAHPLAKSYKVLSQLSAYILENQGSKKIGGILLDTINPSQELRVGNYMITATIAKRKQRLSPQSAYGIVLATGENSFVISGSNLYLTFKPLGSGPAQAGFKKVSEGSFVHGKWFETRRLNGDEIDDGRHLLFPGDDKELTIQNIEMYRYN